MQSPPDRHTPRSASPSSGWSATVLAALIATGGIGRGALGEEGTSRADARDRDASASQMKAMQLRAASLAVFSGKQNSKQVALVETAILRYNNPGGEETADGSIWAWGKSGRPVALAAIFFSRLPPKGEEKWSCELLSLADEPVSVKSPAGWTWTPAGSAIRLAPVPGAPAVAEGEAERGRQMKELCRRFSVSETFRETRIDQLRLMVRALHRYSDPDRGLLDGALYAFASGTNPEALLLLEARQDSSGRAEWHFGFARLGAAMCTARHDDKVVWECPAIEAWDSREPYYSMFGPDAAVFGAQRRRGD